MQTPDYYWNYLPLLLQILVAVGLGGGIVTASYFIGRHRRTATKLATYECGIVAEGEENLQEKRYVLPEIRDGHACSGDRLSGFALCAPLA